MGAWLKFNKLKHVGKKQMYNNVQYNKAQQGLNTFRIKWNDVYNEQYNSAEASY